MANLEHLANSTYACLLEGVRASRPLRNALMEGRESLDMHKKLLLSRHLGLSQSVARGLAALCDENNM